ncbi:MAG: zf-HC2 domain-containing protein [Deltaproteobacteria bacterium]|nr:hypothetical protein [Candidatus Deferrimicrobiaceae bacterium]
MLSCKDVTQLLSQSMDAPLPAGKRIGVRFHLLICKFCVRYRQQLLLIREAARRLAGAADLPQGSAGENLSAEARDRIKKSLRSRSG